MYGSYLERGKKMMMNIQCPNGNCSQRKCLLRHSGPPPNSSTSGGCARGITDRAESIDGNAVNDSNLRLEEMIRKATEESLRSAYSCIYCGLVMDSLELLQAHRIECSEIGVEIEPCAGNEGVGEEKSLSRSWMEQEEDEDRERRTLEV